MPRPKPRIYREHVRRGHKKTYRDQDGRRRTHGGRLYPTTVLATLDPDAPSMRCTGLTSKGKSCGRYACLGSNPPLCHSHGAKRTAKRKNCSTGMCPAKYPHKAFGKGCARERPGVIMGLPGTAVPSKPLDWRGIDWSAPYKPF